MRLEPLTLGGVRQWVLVRGRSAASLILLKLHGGPGQAEMATAGLNGLLEDVPAYGWARHRVRRSYSASVNVLWLFAGRAWLALCDLFTGQAWLPPGTGPSG